MMRWRKLSEVEVANEQDNFAAHCLYNKHELTVHV